jgi:transposase
MRDAPRLEDYQPSETERRQLWDSWPLARRKRRFSEAIDRLKAIRELAARETTESERAATLRKLTESSRTSLRRWQQRYTEQGFDGLIDWRVPPVAAPMPKEVEGAICTLRQADPNVAVATIVEHVRKHHGYEVSETTIKRVLREHGLERRPGPVSNSEREDRRLELGGMKLVEAALVETGYLEALTLAVQEHVAESPVPEKWVPPDTSGRDEYGRFVPDYNERYRKGEDDAIGPGFASVEHKRIGMDPRRLHLYGARYDAVEPKMLALMTSHLLGNGRWDGIRVARGELLEDLCGYAYMPATLDLFTRELKYLGVSSTLWEVHARHWLERTKDWGTEREAAVLYIDATNKPVWTDLFSQSSKVSSTGRVMPALETVAFHSGYGVPLWMVTSSGRTPLVKAIPGMLDELCEINEGAEIGRIVVIDAEGNSVPFLKGLEQGSPQRGWVTRLRPSLIEGKTVFERSRYRGYRDGDRVRVGMADLHDPESPETPFRIRVVEIERRSKGTTTYLGASMLLDEQEWGASAIADLYFARWPKQEANFRAVNQALGLKEVHGYGKQLVDNISVVTRLDELEQKIPCERERLTQLTEQSRSDQQRLEQQRKLLAKTEQRHAVLERQLHARLSKGKLITPQLQQLAADETETGKQIRSHERLVARSDKKATLSQLRVEKQQNLVDKHLGEQQTIASRRRIYQHDVELDSIFSLMKVGLVLTITVVLKEYLGNACMEALTFLERVATLPARLQVLPDLEILTFEHNHRDPEVMALLAAHCEAINTRALKVRSGRTLRIHVEPAPPPTRPPTGRRTKTMERFRRK